MLDLFLCNVVKVSWFLVFTCSCLCLISCDDQQDQHIIISEDSTSDVRVLIVADPFAQSMKASEQSLSEQLGFDLEIDVVPYDVMYDMIKKNGELSLSRYDVISVDVVWLGEFHDKNLLLSLNDFIQTHQQRLQVEDLIPAAYEQGKINDQVYLIPIQPHAELLWYRKDLFEKHGIKPPTNTDELLAAAKALHHSNENIVGIAWNAHQGSPLGQTMAHLYAAFGQPDLLDAEGQPNLDTPAGVEAGEYALELMKYSSQNILHMAWDGRIALFQNGGAAMTYGWAARAKDINNKHVSNVSSKVGFLPAPAKKGEKSRTPLGTWSLAIPSNIGQRKALAEKTLLALSESSGMQLMAHNGNSAVSRLSLMRDEALQQRYPVLEVMVQMSDEGLLDWKMRPQAPIWRDLEQALGHAFHAMLRGEISPQEAAALAQIDAIKLSKQRAGLGAKADE